MEPIRHCLFEGYLEERKCSVFFEMETFDDPQETGVFTFQIDGEDYTYQRGAKCSSVSYEHESLSWATYFKGNVKLCGVETLGEHILSLAAHQLRTAQSPLAARRALTIDRSLNTDKESVNMLMQEQSRQMEFALSGWSFINRETCSATLCKMGLVGDYLDQEVLTLILNRLHQAPFWLFAGDNRALAAELVKTPVPKALYWVHNALAAVSHKSPYYLNGAALPIEKPEEESLMRALSKPERRLLARLFYGCPVELVLATIHSG